MDVDVELYSRVKKQRNESFRMLAPSGTPVKQQLIDPETGEVVERSDTRKGLEVGADSYKPMGEAEVEKITERSKTTSVKEQYVPLGEIALDLAIDRFAVRPDEDNPQSVEALNIVWNGLRATGAAWVCGSFSSRGTSDGILVLYADEAGMWGALLPFEEELYPTPTWLPTKNAKQAKLFGGHIKDEIGIDQFDHASYVSEYRTRRRKVIEAVLNDEDVELVAPSKPKEEKVDLLAALEAA
jgi:DNA end-binding protein Ku